MMKRLMTAMLAVMLILLPMAAHASELNLQPKPMPVSEALTFTSGIRLGWNLGNTFDASECNWLSNEMQYESAWCGVKTREELFDRLVEAGFNAVRIPVSWHNHVDEDYTISPNWLARVKEVVDWAYSRDMYVILNIHHDNSTDFFYPNNEYMEQSLTYVTRIWAQLADAFAEYGERLIFNTLNEPRLVNHPNEWWFNESDPVCQEAAECINQLNQAAVNTIRAAGGQNATRYILCPGYDASAQGATNKYFRLPTDPVESNDGHILVSVHAYTPYNFALEGNGKKTWSRKNGPDLNGMTSFMQTLYNKYILQGVGVIIDEFGARNREGNTEARREFAQSYVAEAKSRGIPAFWWDNNGFNGGEEFGLINRRTCTWVYPEIVEAMMGELE